MALKKTIKLLILVSFLFISVNISSLTKEANILSTESSVQSETMEKIIIPDVTTTKPQLNSEAITKLISQTETNDKISLEDKSHIVETCKKINENIKNIELWKKKSEEWDLFKNNAPDLIENIKKELSLEKKIITPESAFSMTSLQMETSLLQIKADLKSIETRANEQETNLKSLPERRKELPALISETRHKIETLKNQQIDLGTDSIPEKIICFELLNDSLIKLEEEKFKCLEKEMLLYDIQLDVLKKRRDKEQKKLIDAKKLLNIWQKLLSEKRKNEAEEDNRKAREAIRNTIASHESIKKLAFENKLMTDLRTGPNGLTSKIETISMETTKLQSLVSRIREDFLSIQEKIKASGLTHAIGMFLRLKKSELPDEKQIQNKLEKRKEIIGRVQVEILELDDKLKKLSQMDSLSTSIKKQIDKQTLPEHRKEFYNTIDNLLIKQKQYAEALYNDYNTYFIRLIELDAVAVATIEESKKFRNFIDERVLWIRSNHIFSFNKIFRSISIITSILSIENWIKAIKFSISTAKQSPFLWTLVALLMILLYKIKIRIIIQCNKVSEMVKKATTDKLSYTFEAIFLSLVLSSRRPLILFFLSQLLRDSEGFPKALSHALLATSIIHFILLICRNILVSGGIADLHFRWKPPILCETLHLHFSRMILFLMPIYFIWNLIGYNANENISDSAIRFIFMIGLLIYFYLFHIFLKPTGDYFNIIYSENPNNLLFKLRYPIYITFSIIPLILVFLCIAGYAYTAQRIFQSLNLTFLLFFGTLITFALFERIRRVLRNYLARKTAEQKKEFASQHPNTENNTIAEITINDREFQPTIQVIGEQAKTVFLILCVVLFFTGIYFIWKDIFPALRIISQVELWTTTVSDYQTTITPDGGVLRTPIDKIVAINLFDLLTFITVIIITIIASMNLTGFLEFTLFALFKMESGVKFAIRTITRYIITILGLIYAFGIIGLSWNKVQWLLTALTVGLGFGLQEIFANFISGLIILFEMPIRVGDIVTIGDITGTVTRIHIRGTTITNWDKKEIIIPNKEFITGQVINWTLSDSIMRIIFKVGVAYGSDVPLVLSILQKIPQNHPGILREPAPIVLFDEFGDSSLNFELRVFLPKREGYEKITTDINVEIDSQFKKHGIEIPFPQRDLHIRSVDEKIPKVFFEKQNN